jgi:hypothetical protein
MVQEVGDTLTVGAEFTVTVVAVEFTAAPVLSVTWSMKLQVPVVVEPEVTKLKLAEFDPTLT